MTIRIVGAGLGRTGTHSLKLALEQLLGAPCYHMVEVFAHPEHVPVWHAAMLDGPVDWPAVFDGYDATVDWPGGGVWQSISVAYPDAKVLLSSRRSADEWWTSASKTIFEALGGDGPIGGPDRGEWTAMATAMMKRLTPDFPDEAACKAAYERHNATVRAEVPASQLIDWQPQDGWGPLCAGLGIPEPSDPFPVTNTTAEFRAMAGLDQPQT
jgi:hypothetical protein